MSAEDAKNFVDQVTSDPGLQAEVKNSQGNLVGLAAQKGYSFTQDELNNELQARWGVNPADGTAAQQSQCTDDDCCWAGEST